jgi:polar amino acid transport system permease protein
MGLWHNSKTNGSAEAAWYAVTVGAVLLVAGLIAFGPTTALDSGGKPYNPFPELAPRLLRGLWITAQVVAAALVCSLSGGILIGVGRVTRFWPARFAASVYVEIVRGIPLLVILFMIYYGLNQFLPPAYKLGAFASAIVGLSICYSAFMGEAVRAGIEAIPHEEIEAGSLEGDRLQVLWHVTLPRAVRTMLPAVANECIALLKDSSLISILAISELTRSGQEYASTKFLFFETYTMVALVYLILTLALSRCVRTLERTWAAS